MDLSILPKAPIPHYHPPKRTFPIIQEGFVYTFLDVRRMTIQTGPFPIIEGEPLHILQTSQRITHPHDRIWSRGSDAWIRV